jgi:hypothetical protein
MENPSTRYTTAQRHILKLRDVISCEIQSEPDGGIAAVHVTARAGRSPRLIVRDIEAILAAEERIEIDHRKISVAQYDSSEAPEAFAEPAGGLARISLGGVSIHHAPQGIEVEVTLSAGSVQATGRATGASTRWDVRRVVAQSTLDAVAKLVDGDPALSLGELEERELGDKQVVLVCVNRAQGRGEVNLIGCCESGYDPTQAVIFAVLDAINRIVGTFRPREPVEFEIGPAPAP